jgi:hypothetical protein
MHTIFKFFSLNPHRRKAIFPQSSFRITWVQTWVLSHFRNAFWGRNSLCPNKSYKIKKKSKTSVLVYRSPKSIWKHRPASVSTSGSRSKRAANEHSNQVLTQQVQ